MSHMMSLILNVPNTQLPLAPHVTLLRKWVGCLILAYLGLMLIAAFALGELGALSGATVLELLGAAVLSTVVYLAAAPISRRITRRNPPRLYAVTLIRLFSVALFGNPALIFAMMNGNYLTYVIGGTATIAALALAVWPRRALIPVIAEQPAAA